MDQHTITIISFGHFGKDFLEKIAEVVKEEFLCSVNIKESRIDLSELYDPARRQYDGNKLLKAVDAMAAPESIKTLGLFNVDLFIPILTYIFGQAFLGGNSGIASTYRLKNELYGIKQNEELLHDRFRKVCIHELGHTFGLIHCHTPDCVMRSGTYVEDIDQKNHRLCIRCRNILKESRVNLKM
ncbi:MAG: archaemetzincin family Zn-dependent metalloprotease [Bacteroidia bacterium]|nr:archaemetzincin family Zn-dependent metalloprotease [Bacteroidia bacterium]